MEKKSKKKEHSENKDPWAKEVMDDLMKNKIKQTECECCSHCN